MSKFSDRYDPGPQIAQCGAINLGTTDLEKSLFFFRDTLGMEEVERRGNEVYLRCYQELGHHSLVLTQQDEAMVNSYSFRVKRPQDVELFHEELKRQDIEVLELAAGSVAGRGTAIRFLLPGGDHPFELYYDIDKPMAPEALRSRLLSNSSKRRGLATRRIDHFNIQTSPETINQAEQWVRDTLGFKRREFAHIPEHPDTILASWMSVTPQVHDLAIVANPEGKKAQCHHVAFNMQDFSDVLSAADTLKDLDVTFDVGPGKHGIGQAMYLYVFDPGSGHRVELYAGGYLIFDPDWEAIEWKRETFPDGLTYYGDTIDPFPPSISAVTTNSAGLILK
ncbi:MAG: catechol 1,2-dioxygenase [Confluentimicrobium sp.]|uniref:VOC family protein n=1 Tax=Actibacterium sp. TaxID=1872125 RepID=UPI000C5E4F8F|nr:VOC family protein [Actibacterium sp.]MBC56634.1 catechol 1,2-dioxygenase [Actibacterium sp.]|tara:strand:+ start:9931 stop:10938 length:1008 start_codon:yes stop_codon:yes gene_type:complete